MNRRWMVLILVVGLAAFSLWVWRWRPPESGASDDNREVALNGPGPNILVYMIDTLRAREIGAYGARIARTPAMDTFAAESTLFENAKTPSSWTRPAVASLITGVSPSVHGVETFDFLDRFLRPGRPVGRDYEYDLIVPFTTDWFVSLKKLPNTGRPRVRRCPDRIPVYPIPPRSIPS